MAADRRRFAWMDAMLTLLVALALLFAPVASVQAMACHDRLDHAQQSSFVHSPVLRNTQASSDSGFHTPDHKGCCAVRCAFCVVLAVVDREDAPAAMSSFLRFAWADQTGSGLALPPMLGPPRLSV
ncbi:hypothetical protein [Rhizobium sp. P28RR-XV]|uniref:hypothetical protein n=1 Tax=Rhizobium sp. P28RR-XV TaxID=2726737 RepID=UPI00145656FE|nr:hypothetical protein [Rhizobium sp. P28RR-XV]NLR86224.1 hypothetical protein [Rhizobium sp. P28RR-XV]NLR86366.1 hypothetical protein [Rhizobium sp. P28RR-XV]